MIRQLMMMSEVQYEEDLERGVQSGGREVCLGNRKGERTLSTAQADEFIVYSSPEDDDGCM